MNTSVEKQFIPVPGDSGSLKFLYETPIGRLLLRPMLGRGLSDLAGRFLDSPLSRHLIPFFIKKSGIDLAEYVPCHYRTFNECFSRHILPEKRPIDPEDNHLISPCDGLLRVYPIEKGAVIPVKQSRYTIADLLRDEALAAEFEGGSCMVFRLCVNHYHRYCYPISGSKSTDVLLPGLYHTVQPIALRNGPVFVENTRCCTILTHPSYGRMVQMEVGALLVGKIRNNRSAACRITRGKEKGTFLYGGSTIILLLKKDQVQLPEWFHRTAQEEVEIPVKCGQWLGTFL